MFFIFFQLMNVSDCFSNCGIHSYEDILKNDTGQVIALRIPQGTVGIIFISDTFEGIFLFILNIN